MSGAVDLIGEYGAALDALTPAHRKRLEALGLAAAAKRIGLAGVASIREIDGGLWEPGEGGQPAVIIPAWDRPIANAVSYLDFPEMLIDLVAWRPKLGATLLTRCGLAAALGVEALAAARIAKEPVRVFRDPGSWARAGGGSAGVVVIDWSGDVGLLGCKRVVADDVEHGIELKARLKGLRQRLVNRVPLILVPEESVAGGVA